LAVLDPLAGLASTDLPALTGLLEELDFDLPELQAVVDGVVGAASPRLQAAQDEAPEPPETPDTREGDLYLLGRHRLACGDATQSTVWDIPNLLRVAAEEKTGHGTEKPVECMARPMRNHGAAGDVVYDPFVGSGTSLVAAEQLDRSCVALELDPRYCDVVVA